MESTISMDGFASGASLESCAPFPRHWRHLTNLEKIGHGASGDVYRAWEPLLEREVALKLSRRMGDFCDTCSVLALREARLLARIRHPNVVTVYGVDYEGRRLGVWMEYIRGMNLDALLRQHGPLRVREVTVIGLDLCSAVTAAHDLGLLHGDITAKNVMHEKTGRIVLLDFGFSQDLHTAHREEGDFNIRGTPLYMAPEILRGDRASPQSDIYAIGVLLYRLSTGRFPIEARTLVEMQAVLKSGNVVLLRDAYPCLGEAFVTTIDRSIAPEPAARFTSVAEMASWLRASLDPDASQAETTGSISTNPKRRWPEWQLGCWKDPMAVVRHPGTSL